MLKVDLTGLDEGFDTECEIRLGAMMTPGVLFSRMNLAH